MASEDYHIVLIVMTMSIVINVWFALINNKINKENYRLHALNARYAEYQDGYFSK